MPDEHSHSGHDHGHSDAPAHSNSAFAVGVTLNIGFVVAETVYGVASNSLALLSDAAHNLGDVFGLLIAWGAIHLGKSLPTKRRTYGLRRSTVLAALTNAIVLLVIVGGIVWEAIGRITHPEVVASNTVIWVAAAGVVINTISALLFMTGRKRDININGAFVHMAGDAAVSLAVVFVGLGIATTGWIWLDPAVSILIGIVIIWGTWSLLRESFNLALDAVPAGIDPHAVESYLAGLPGVQAVHDLHIWGMSTTEAALTAHLVMPRPPSDDRLLHAVCSELYARFKIGHVTIQIEHGDPDHFCHQAPADVV
jgi:cobalt-zinc-cadmium efflux system protein